MFRIIIHCRVSVQLSVGTRGAAGFIPLFIPAKRILASRYPALPARALPVFPRTPTNEQERKVAPNRIIIHRLREWTHTAKFPRGSEFKTMDKSLTPLPVPTKASLSSLFPFGPSFSLSFSFSSHPARHHLFFCAGHVPPLLRHVRRNRCIGDCSIIYRFLRRPAARRPEEGRQGDLWLRFPAYHHAASPAIITLTRREGQSLFLFRVFLNKASSAIIMHAIDAIICARCFCAEEVYLDCFLLSFFFIWNDDIF